MLRLPEVVRAHPRVLVLAAFAVVVAVALAVSPGAWPFALLAVIGATWAVLRWSAPTDAPTMDGLTRAALLLPVAIGLVVPVLIGAQELANLAIRELEEIGAGSLWSYVLAFAVVSIALVAIARAWPDSLPDWLFLGGLMFVFLLVKVAYLLLVANEPISDFAGQWRLAGSVLDRGLEVVIESRDHLDRIHFERVAAYLLPLQALFGTSRWAYALPNVLSLLACSLLTYHLCRAWFGRRPARVACVISLLAVEPTLAAGIPTHDIPGTLLTLLVIVCFLATDRALDAERWKRGAALSLLLAFLYVAVDLQRTNRFFLVLAFAVMLAAALFVAWWRERPAGRAYWRRAGARLALALVVPLALATAGDAILRANHIRMPADEAAYWKYRALAAHSDSWTYGRQVEAIRAYYDVYLDLEAENWQDLGRRKLLTDLYRNPGERLAGSVRRSASLWSLGRQLNFYMGEARSPGSGDPLHPVWRLRATVLNAVYSSFFSICLAIGAVSAFRTRGLPLYALLPALYLALFSAALILTFQTQSRYMFHAWYLGALYVGWLFGKGRPELSTEAATSEPGEA